MDGRTSTAKALVTDCVVVTQNRHCIAQLDKAVYGERGIHVCSGGWCRVLLKYMEWGNGGLSTANP